MLLSNQSDEQECNVTHKDVGVKQPQNKFLLFCYLEASLDWEKKQLYSDNEHALMAHTMIPQYWLYRV